MTSSDHQGPKGVLQDYELYKQRERQSRIDQVENAINDMKTRVPLLRGASEENELDSIRLKRIMELKGKIASVENIDELWERINSQYSHLIHVKSEKEASKRISSFLPQLVENLNVKAIEVEADLIDFSVNSLPALLLYREGELVQSFVCLDAVLSLNFSHENLLNYLMR